MSKCFIRHTFSLFYSSQKSKICFVANQAKSLARLGMTVLISWSSIALALLHISCFSSHKSCWIFCKEYERQTGKQLTP